MSKVHDAGVLNPVLLALCLVALHPPAAAADSDPLGLKQGPVIRLEERRWDFGQMRQHAEAQHSFRFWNDGNEPLRILEIDTDCGCTAGVAGDTVLAPGKESRIDVTFQSRSAEGKIQKVVIVKTNDPGEPRIDLVVSADVKPWVKINPRTLDFGEVRRGDTPRLTTLLQGDPGVGFQVKEVTGGDGHVTWKITPQGADAFQVEATLKPDAPMGKFHQRALVELQHPNIDQERIFIRGFVYSYFVLEEARINFATVRRGETKTKSLTIQSDGTRPYEITSVRTDNPHLNPKLARRGNGYELEVTLNAPEEKIRIIDEVTLRTTDPNAPEIKVEIRGVVL